MSGIMDLNILLKDMEPVLAAEDYVFCSLDGKLDQQIVDLNPLCTMQEDEGLTLILARESAERANISYDGIYQKITLHVHSSLEAVGLTAAFSKALTDAGISANVIAGYYHDHIFVPKEKADAALSALIKLTRQ